MSADVFVGLHGTMPVTTTTYVDAYYWRCDICGWLGVRLASIEAAMGESARHVEKAHPEVGERVDVERKDIAVSVGNADTTEKATNE